MTSADGTTFIIAYQYGSDEDLDELAESAARELTNKVTQASPTEQNEINLNQQVRQEPLGNLGADVDREFLQNFLSGRECLPGGNGWWKYEICYGKHVIQFHVKNSFYANFELRLLFLFIGRRTTSSIDFTWNMES